MASQFLRKHKMKPSFFKVLIYDFSTRLQIPPAFIKEFGKDEVPKKTTLETYNGKSWKVGVEKLGKKFYFNNGWDKFVRVNSLENGDFLVLKYFADYSKFKVKIYGKTCCEKQLNVVVGETCSKPLNGKQNQRHKKEKRKRKRDGHEDDDIVNKDGESKAFEDEVIKVDPDSSFSFEDDDDNNEEQEIGGTEKRRKAQTVEFKRNKKYGRVPADHHNHIKFKSKDENPFFQFQLCHSTFNFYLHIPKVFFKEHMKENKRMELKVSERTYNLEIYVCDDGTRTKRREEARVSKGWKRFVEEHHLKMGDVCVFEMTKKSYGSDHSVFLVHVYRWDHQKVEFSKII